MSERNKVRAHAIIRGRVQGVCYRLSTRDEAWRIGGLTGWVRNRADGSVETVIEGEDTQVTALLEWCKKGPAMAAVIGVDVDWEPYTGEFREFDITR